MSRKLNINEPSLDLYVIKLRKKAKDLREDTMESLSGSVTNGILAAVLEEIANDIEEFL